MNTPSREQWRELALPGRGHVMTYQRADNGWGNPVYGVETFSGKPAHMLWPEYVILARAVIDQDEKLNGKTDDMYEALQAVWAAVTDPENDSWIPQEAGALVKAALAKTRGETDDG